MIAASVRSSKGNFKVEGSLSTYKNTQENFMPNKDPSPKDNLSPSAKKLILRPPQKGERFKGAVGARAPNPWKQRNIQPQREKSHESLLNSS